MVDNNVVTDHYFDDEEEDPLAAVVCSKLKNGDEKSCSTLYI
jgi:hypothetical protein